MLCYEIEHGRHDMTAPPFRGRILCGENDREVLRALVLGLEACHLGGVSALHGGHTQDEFHSYAGKAFLALRRLATRTGLLTHWRRETLLSFEGINSFTVTRRALAKIMSSQSNVERRCVSTFAKVPLETSHPNTPHFAANCS